MGSSVSGKKKVAVVLALLCLAGIAGLLLLCVATRDLRDSPAFKVRTEPEEEEGRAGSGRRAWRLSPGKRGVPLSVCRLQKAHSPLNSPRGWWPQEAGRSSSKVQKEDLTFRVTRSCRLILLQSIGALAGSRSLPSAPPPRVSFQGPLLMWLVGLFLSKCAN